MFSFEFDGIIKIYLLTLSDEETRLQFMKKFIIIIVCVCYLASCSPNQRQDNNSAHHFQESFLDVVLDSTSTWQQILDAANLFADSLCIIAIDTLNGNNRLAAQQWGYMAIYTLSDLYEQKKEKGLDVNYSDIYPIIDQINYAASVWIKTDYDDNTYIWRDHFYNSHQQAKKPIPGYFNFMIVLPKTNSEGNTLRITFPITANKDFPPLLAFKNYENGSLNEKDDFEEAVQLVDEIKVDTDTNIMYADVDEEIVSKMLQYDILYLMFQSKATGDGATEEIEITRVSLAPLQQIFKL